MGKGNLRNKTCPCGSGKKSKRCCLSYNGKIQEYLPKEVYDKDLIPYITARKDVLETIFEIQVVLPFRLNIEDRIIQDFDHFEDMVVFRFEEVTVTETNNYGFSEVNSTKIVTRAKVTIGVGVGVEHTEVLENLTKYLGEYQEVILHYLNKVILSYMLTTYDEESYYITKNMLEFNTVVNVIDMENWTVYKKEILQNRNGEGNTPKIMGKDFNRYLNLSRELVYGDNTLLYSYQYELYAKRSMGQGFYGESVINIQTSVEILIKTILRKILEAEGMGNKDIEKQLRKSIVYIVKKELGKKLNGTWGTELEDWEINTNRLRNRVIHSGEQPKYEEAHKAIESALKFKEGIENRVKLTKDKYPEIIRLFI